MIRFPINRKSKVKNHKLKIMTSKSKLVPRQLLIPFILVTTLFFAWGFANDITNPMVKAFSKIFRMSVTDGALVQLAFYGGYFAMAFPAALFIRKYSYKTGILLGLGLYAVGALLFIPGKYDRTLLSVFNCLFYSYLWPVLSGNQLQSIYPHHGEMKVQLPGV